MVATQMDKVSGLPVIRHQTDVARESENSLQTHFLFVFFIYFFLSDDSEFI